MHNSIRITVVSWIPAVIWMGIIFFFSARTRISVSEEQLINFLFFKFLHVFEYAVLFTLYARALKRTVGKSDKTYIFRYACVMMVLYAVSDEIHQLFTPTREGRLRDVIIDMFGGILAWIGLSIAPHALKKHKVLASLWQKFW